VSRRHLFNGSPLYRLGDYTKGPAVKTIGKLLPPKLWRQRDGSPVALWEGFSEEAHEIRPIHKWTAEEFVQLQWKEPQLIETSSTPAVWVLWAYHWKIVRVRQEDKDFDGQHDRLLVKRHVLRDEQNRRRLEAEVLALEAGEPKQNGRPPIPDPVKHFVWQRDQGRCVSCGSRERLEYDHIIPVVEGGSSTERNLQLLCEGCNRSKGANITP
jgi:hypothetical protein